MYNLPQSSLHACTCFMQNQVRFPWSYSGTRPLWRITPPNFVLFHGMFPHSESYFRASGWFSSPAYSQSSKCTLSHLYKRAMNDYVRSQSHTEGVCSSLHYPCPRDLSGSGLSSTFAGLQKEAPEKLECGGQKTGGCYVRVPAGLVKGSV